MTVQAIAVIGTGGTIAGVIDRTDENRYTAAQLTAKELLARSGVASSHFELTAIDACAVAGQAMTEKDWIVIGHTVCRAIENENVAGVVVTAGTDTLEELAYFLHLTASASKPVVVVGAMRTLDSPRTDAIENLEKAVAYVEAKAIDNRNADPVGTVVVMNGSVFGARGIRKAHTTAVNSFRAIDTTTFDEISRTKFGGQKAPTSEFAIKQYTTLPLVDLLYGYAGDNSHLVRASVEQGVRGIVYGGVGNGNHHPAVDRELRRAGEEFGVVVVRSSRVEHGRVDNSGESDSTSGFIAAGDLTPAQARVLLTLALTVTDNRDEVEKIFDHY
ncbi:asparaginase [Rhodococcus sp. IEGM 1318]|uniref:asparaginase n=1 Tax=Rhodococcus sp. IEGM 1318 TaxID=3082226 RepID=UPI002953B4DF|nr:asparaginase domain-containing protein [Rhodococcus sp. IEGM 1318]MDV8009498.1 asparaginase domain-containing protein [Rhodococcus sp. IEGM 1318]